MLKKPCCENFTFIFCSSAQDVNNGDTRPLQVRFEGPKTRTTYVGGELAFSCVFNRGLLYVIKNIVETVRQSVDGTEVVLAKAAMLDKGEPGYYSADVTQLQEEHIRLDFNITNGWYVFFLNEKIWNEFWSGS